MSTQTLRCFRLKSSGSSGYGMRWNHSSFTASTVAGCGRAKSTTVCDTDHVATDNVRADGRRRSTCDGCATSWPSPRSATSGGPRPGCTSRRRRSRSASASSSRRSALALFERTSRRVALTAGRRAAARRRPRGAPGDGPLRRRGGRAGARRPPPWPSATAMAARAAVMRGDPGVPRRPPRRRGSRRRPDLAAHPRRRCAPGRSPPASSVDRSPIPIASPSVPLARVAVDHVAVPPGHRLAAGDVVHAGDLDGEAGARRRPGRCADRPRRDRGLLRGRRSAAAVDHPRRRPGRAGARPGRRWAAGIGWLNAWQAERGGSAPGRRRAAVAAGGAVRRVPDRVVGGRSVADRSGVRAGCGRHVFGDVAQLTFGVGHRCERVSASERAVSSGLRGRGTH